MSIAKVTLRFDVLPEEKELLETICDSFHISKIEFLRRSMSQVKNGDRSNMFCTNNLKMFKKEENK